MSVKERAEAAGVDAAGMLTLAQAAEYLSVSEAVVEGLAHYGFLNPVMRIDGVQVYDCGHLREAMMFRDQMCEMALSESIDVGREICALNIDTDSVEALAVCTEVRKGR